MYTIEILPKYEAKKFDQPIELNPELQKEMFKIDKPIEEQLCAIQSDENKIGLLLQYGYFKVYNKFFTRDKFRKEDIEFVCSNLALDVNKTFDYNDKTRQRHQVMILEILGYKSFSEAIEFFDSTIAELVSRQMHPRKIFHSIVELLIGKKIEIPSYDFIAKAITKNFNVFEAEISRKLSASITDTQIEALNQLLVSTGEYQRPLLTRLKQLCFSTRPSKIKQGIRNFLVIKKLFNEISPLIKELDLSSEATRYYAQWLIKAQTHQAAIMPKATKKYIYLIAFVDYYFKIWQDVFIDILIKSVQQQLNKIERISADKIKEELPQRNCLTSSVVSGFFEAKDTVKAASRVLYNQDLDNDSKVLNLYQIVPDISDGYLNEAEENAQKLKRQIYDDTYDKDQINILGMLSRKLQNRLSEIVRYLIFAEHSENDNLMIAIQHYQKYPIINASAPTGFLNDIEYKEICSEGKFNVSLYKAILFCKIANSIKSGEISLVHSYRYLPVDSYLISLEYWNQNRERLLKELNLEHLININAILGVFEENLDKKYFETNKNILIKKNKYVKIHKDGHLSLYTPPVPKPDYDSVREIIGKERYVPILQIMSEVNTLTDFTRHFKHYKIKSFKDKPNNETFYAGVFGLASGMELHKFASTAIGIKYNTLINCINWYFYPDNLYELNQELVKHMAKLSLPNKFKREQALLHTSSDVQKRCVSAESLNADYSYKHHGSSKVISINRFLDERGILFYTNVFGGAERDSAYLIDGICSNNEIYSDIHSTDTLGYTEVIFGVADMLKTRFAPRIKDVMSQKLVSFQRIKSQLDKKGYPITPSYYVQKEKIVNNWDMVLRLIVTIKLGLHKPSVIFKRLNSYLKQHPLQEALKEYGRITKSLFILEYIDNVQFRQIIEKQLNKGELANKFASAISFASESMTEISKEDQEIFALCQTIIQNIIILWNYVALTKIIMRSDAKTKDGLIKDITTASILTWGHVNLYGTYDFSNLPAANDSDFDYEDIVNYKIA